MKRKILFTACSLMMSAGIAQLSTAHAADSVGLSNVAYSTQALAQAQEAAPYQVKIISSGIEGIEYIVYPNAARLTKVETRHGTFNRLSQSGGEHRGMLSGPEYVSTPELPMFSALFAVPVDGKVADISIQPEDKGRQQAARLYPIQPPTRSALGSDDKVEFAFDEKRYFGASTRMGALRSVKPVSDGDSAIRRLSFNLADYDAEKEVLTTYDAIRVRIKFASASGCFKQVRESAKLKKDEVDLLWERQPQPLQAALLNPEVLESLTCPGKFTPIVIGAQLIIVTHPDFEVAAETLRAHKVSRGISTKVVTTQDISDNYGDGSGNVTDEEIRDYLVDQNNNNLVKPKWVLLMGDAEYIPTHYTDQQNFWDSAMNAGDQYYGQFDGNDLSIPEVGIGRFPVDTNEQAEVIVNRVISYESSPVFLFGNFYSDYTFAAEFQDRDSDDQADRWFVETSEHIRDYLVGKNFDVQRIYNTDWGTSPTWYYDGTEIPEELQIPNFAWDGDDADIVDAVNDGTAILYHRDHGWWTGWGTPAFNTADLASLNISGNEYPMVFSINCASGIFDNETVDLPENIVDGGYGPAVGTTYWAETFLRQEEGALGVIGDTRSSSTSANNPMAKGLFDAIFPEYDNGFGGSSTIRTLGDVLNHAKSYVAAAGYSDDSVKQENTIYNLLGDPSLRLRTHAPFRLILDRFRIYPDLVIFDLRPEEQQCKVCPPPQEYMQRVRAVLQDAKTGEVISRALVNGKNQVSLPTNGFKGEAVVTFSEDNMSTLTQKLSIR